MARAKARANGHLNGAPTVAVKLDKIRHLRLDMNALAIAEDVAGVNLISDFAKGKVTAKEFRGIVYGLLLHEDPELTEDKVGAMLHPGNMVEVAEAVKGLVAGVNANPKEASG